MAAPAVPLNTANEQPTRRGMIGRLAAAGAIGTTPALASTLAVDPHPEWEREMLANDAYCRSSNAEWMGLSEERAQAHLDRYQALQDWMFTTPPTTLSGAAAVVRATCYFVEEIGCELGDDQLGALHRVATLVDRLAAGRA